MVGSIGRIDEIVIDCRDPEKLATFWAALLGVAPAVQDTWATLRDPENGLVVAFQEVPEPKAGKNRLHLDVRVADLEEATAACVILGATADGPVVEDADGSFQVMFDPEGHEFCLVTSSSVRPRDHLGRETHDDLGSLSVKRVAGAPAPVPTT